MFEVHTNAFYDAIAQHYHLFYRDWWAAVERDGAFLARLFADQGVHTVLDMSCGSGTQTIGLAKRGFQVTGIDPSEGLLALAKGYAEQIGLTDKVTLMPGSFLQVPEALIEPFDAVITTGNSLPHLIEDLEIEEALTLMFEHLRPGGMLVIGIRDFDRMIEERLRFFPRQIHDDGEEVQHILFDIRDWDDGPPITVTFNTFVVSGSGDEWGVQRYPVTYRALRQSELQMLLEEVGFVDIATTEHLWEIIFIARRPG